MPTGICDYKSQTPYPWINYLGNEDFFSLTSNTAEAILFIKMQNFVD